MAWREQWGRMERYYERIHKAKYGLMPKEQLSTPEQREFVHDDILTFFVYAHHLREWLDADGIEVRGAARASRTLDACGDIANATKHESLERSRVGQPKREGPVVSVILDKEANGYDLGVDLFLSIEGRQFSAFDFATRVRDEWIRILAERGVELDARLYERPKLRTFQPVGPDPNIVSVRLYDVP